MKKLLILTILVIMISITYATDIEEDFGFEFVTGAWHPCTGWNWTPTSESTLVNITANANDGGNPATHYYIFHEENKSLIETGTITSHVATMDILMYVGEYYMILIGTDNCGVGDWGFPYDDSVSYPYSGTTGDLPSAVTYDSGSVTWVNRLTAMYGIEKIGISYISSAATNIIVANNTYENYAINFTSDYGQSCGYSLTGNYSLCGTTSDSSPTFKFKARTGTADFRAYNYTGNYLSYDNAQGDDIDYDNCTLSGDEYSCTIPIDLPDGNHTIAITGISGAFQQSGGFEEHKSNYFNISILSTGCAILQGNNGLINDGGTLYIDEVCSLGANKLNVDNGGLVINNGGKVIANGCAIKNTERLAIDNTATLVCFP